jgi:hypothetical protein
LAPELSRANANAAPSLQHWKHNKNKVVSIDKKTPDILFECGSLACWDNEAERFHDPVDLVGKLDADPDQSGARCYERASQHIVEAFHAHLAKEPCFSKMRQTVGIIRMRLVRRHIESGFGMARINADGRQTLGAKRMIEPYRRGQVSNTTRFLAGTRMRTSSAMMLGSDAHFPRQIRSSPRRID